MLVAVHADCAKKEQPIVDLGYEIYQATGANNIRSYHAAISNCLLQQNLMISQAFR